MTTAHDLPLVVATAAVFFLVSYIVYKLTNNNNK